MEWENPPFGITDEAALLNRFEEHCRKNLAHIAFQPKISKQRILDVFKAWKEDLSRSRHGSFRDNDVTPDHIKCASHLTYWLRREAPVIDLVTTTGMYHEAELFAVETNIGDLDGCTAVSSSELANHQLGNGMTLSDYVESRRLIMAYSNELLAFSFGFTLAKAYEQQKIKEKGGGDVDLPMPNRKYVEDLCYFFKFKSVSPHSIDLIYRALLGRSAA